MCVALPGQVTWIGTASDTSIPARMLVGGTEIDVDLVTVSGVEVGDFVVAHSGYAIRKVAPSAADQTQRDLTGHRSQN